MYVYSRHRIQEYIYILYKYMSGAQCVIYYYVCVGARGLLQTESLYYNLYIFYRRCV